MPKTEKGKLCKCGHEEKYHLSIGRRPCSKPIPAVDNCICPCEEYRVATTPLNPRDQAVQEEFREKFGMPEELCGDYPEKIWGYGTICKHDEFVACGHRLAVVESWFLQKLQEEREIAFKEGAQSRCVHGMWLKDKAHDGEKCRGCGSIIKSK